MSGRRRAGHGALPPQRQAGKRRSALNDPPEILEATKGKVPLFVDCSLQSGLDVFKALALGATACSIGRPLMARLKENGAQGVREGVEAITRDLEYTMAMTCSKDLSSIDPSVVRMGAFNW